MQFGCGMPSPAGYLPASRFQVPSMVFGARSKQISRVTPAARPGLRPHRPGIAIPAAPILGVFFVLAVISVVVLLGLGQGYMAVAAAASGFGIVMGVAGGWIAAHRAIDRPLEQIADSLETLAARDVLALVDEFANLAQGDQPRRLAVYAKPIRVLPGEPRVQRVAAAVNATISRLQAGAYQFYAASGEPCRRLFYVGADDYLLGCTCAEAMGTLLPEGGQVLLLSPHFRHAGVELRRRGFESTVMERFQNLQVVGVLESRFENGMDADRTAELVRAFVKTRPHLAGIYSTEAYGALGAMDALAGTSLAGRIVLIGHDILDRTVAGLQSGLITAVVTQDPFGQGYDTPIHLFNNLAHGWRPPDSRLITKSDVVTRENYHDFWRPYEGVVQSPAMLERRAKPLGPSRRPLRIAILGIDDGSFWEPVRLGVLAAAEELASYNATVEWIIPETGHEFAIATRGREVEMLVEKGYDGIATPIYDPDLVPYLNRAVERGVVVATLNSEASSLQGLVATLSKERRRLELAAGDLEAAAHHDALTGAYNRLVMDEDLAEAERSTLASGKPASVIMIDIDHFKAYNDMVGHTAGDEVLRIVARRIQDEVRPEDRVYRYGGEEFLVLLRQTRLDEGETVAARIAHGIASLGLPHAQNKPWGVVTVSAGVSAIAPDSPEAVDAVVAADTALYRSKASGRNTVATAESEPRPETKRRSTIRAHLP
jgi:diguanylate cyclase (GGDEF)-like protein